MKKLIISGISVAVLSLGLALPLYAAEEAKADAAAAPAAAAPALTAKDGKCMGMKDGAEVEVTTAKNADGKIEGKDKDGNVVATLDSEEGLADECKPKAAEEKK